MAEISKKELLLETGISYGQLYRWKREGLIPEEWFVKRSAFTGQETYFPRDRMLARVRAILALKDTHTLDEIRESFVEKASVFQVKLALTQIVGLDATFVESLEGVSDNLELSIDALAAIAEVSESGKRAKLGETELKALVEESIRIVCTIILTPIVVALVKIADKHHLIMTSPAGEIAVDSGIVVAEKILIADSAERLREKIPILLEAETL